MTLGRCARPLSTGRNFSVAAPTTPDCSLLNRGTSPGFQTSAKPASDWFRNSASNWLKKSARGKLWQNPRNEH